MLTRWLVVGPLVVAVALTCTTIAQQRMDEARANAFDEQLLYLPNEKLLNYLTGGMSSVVADMLWLKCIQYTSKHFRGDHKFTWLAHMCRTITRLDPNFVDAYRYGGIFLAALKADDDASIALMESGIPPNPDRWELPYEIAMVYLLNRRDQPDSPERAAQFLAMSVATGTAPEFVLETARGLALKHNLFDIEAAMWSDMLVHGPDELTRDMAARKLQEVELRKVCAVLSRCVEAYRQRFNRPPAGVEDLESAGLIAGHPSDPLGGTFFIAQDGAVQNTTLLDVAVERRLNQLRTAIEAFEKQRDRLPNSLDELTDAGIPRALPKHPYSDGQWRYDPATGDVTSARAAQG